MNKRLTLALCVAGGLAILSIIVAGVYSCANPPQVEDTGGGIEVHDVQAPVIEQKPTPVVAEVPLIEQKGAEAQTQIPPLSVSGDVGYSNGGKLTYYSSRVLYHYKTGEWRADSHGFYRAGDGAQWCFVVSANSGFGSKLTLSFGTGWVLDSGCAPGVLDMYVNG